MLTLVDLRLGLGALEQLTIKGKDAGALAQTMDRYRKAIAEMEAAQRMPQQVAKPQNDAPPNGEGHAPEQ